MTLSLPADAADTTEALPRMSVARALDALPRRQRPAVILRYLHDLSDADPGRTP